jgi:hypothetical protein
MQFTAVNILSPSPYLNWILIKITKFIIDKMLIMMLKEFKLSPSKHYYLSDTVWHKSFV